MLRGRSHWLSFGLATSYTKQPPGGNRALRAASGSTTVDAVPRVGRQQCPSRVSPRGSIGPGAAPPYDSCLRCLAESVRGQLFRPRVHDLDAGGGEIPDVARHYRQSVVAGRCRDQAVGCGDLAALALRVGG